MAKKKQPDYYKIIPKHLLADNDALVDYVRYFPTKCPHCDSQSFRRTIGTNTIG